MKTVYSVLFCCLATVAFGEMAYKYRDYLLNKHNEFRRNQYASNMNKLRWSEELAQQADEWLSKCQFDYENNGRGMNLAFYTNDNDMENINQAFDDWSNEMNQYDFSGDECGQSCRYSQLVWYNTREVGCAINKCQQLNAYDTVYDNVWYMGCWYSPRGNSMNEYPFRGNEMSEYPFMRGTACSNCAECEDGLCVDDFGGMCEDRKPNCMMWKAKGMCESNRGYMQQYCPQSCGFCDGNQWFNSYNNGECFNESPECESYGMQACRNKPWMRENCRQMCGMC